MTDGAALDSSATIAGAALKAGYVFVNDYGWTHNSTAGDGIGFDDTGLSWAGFLAQPTTVVATELKLMNPMAYVGAAGSTSAANAAPYWYLRAGTRDRDTSFNVTINLAHALESDSDVKEVNYHLAWGQPHAGNNDVPEAMTWVAKVLQAAKAAGL